MQIPGKYNIKLRQLLDYVAQEEIFESLLGIYPIEGDYYCSPFRKDSNPGCYFQMDPNGVIRFMDWADEENNRLDCFDAVKNYFNLSSYLQVVHLIYDTLILGKPVDQIMGKKENHTSDFKPTEIKQETKIMVHPCKFSKRDEEYWSEYGITEEQLLEDKVYSISKVYTSGKKGQHISYCSTKLAYADVNFPSGHKKVYFPEAASTGSLRFLTNCTHNDIGNISKINYQLNYIIITKSHKDCRVLKNLGYSNTVYFSNEGQVPEEKILQALLKSFRFVYIFYDFDDTGIKASEGLKSIIESYYPEKRIFLLYTQNVKIKDISDYYKFLGGYECSQYLKQNVRFI